MQTAGLKGARLSPQQLRLWPWLQGQAEYRVQCVLEIKGDFEPDVLQQALQHVVDRCEILRTTFTHVAGMELPVQTINTHIEIPCPLIDVERLNTAAQRAFLEGTWHDLWQHPFDLEHGPLLHAEAVRLSAQLHVLVLSLHPLCADAATLKHLTAALLQAYPACLQHGGGSIGIAGIAETEEDEPLQYANVTAWLHELLQEEDAEEQLAYWRKFDLSHLSSTALPFIGSNESVPGVWKEHGRVTFDPQEVTLHVPAPLQERLRHLSQQFGASTEAMLLATWQILLWRLTGDPDLLVGLLCDGRPYEELEDLIGPYTRTVPVSTRLTEGSSFAWVSLQAWQSYQEALEKQLYFSWDAVPVEDLPYFPISFACERLPEPVTTGPLTALLQRQVCWQEPFRLHLHVWQSSQELQLQFAYDASLFSKQQASYLALLFEQLLQAVLEQPDAAISALPLLTQGQQVSQQEQLRGLKRDWPFVPLHRLFEEQARRQPEVAALRYGSLLLNYGQVEQQANQLAHILLRHGLIPGARVALCLSRDHWAIISLLAVLKAGGCYVPLDMQMPEARLERLLHQIQPDIIISSQALQERLPTTHARVLWVEWLQDLFSSYPATPPVVEIGPEALAYVMYTSGSTGAPKGVQIRHSSVSNYTRAMCTLLEPQPGWHFATVSSLAADLGNTAIFCGLASGGCVHVLPYEQITDAAAFAAYVERYPIDVLKIVPSHLQALLGAAGYAEVGTPGILPRKRLILGGEALPWSLVEQVQRMGATCQLYNHYGPTEGTIGSLVYPLGAVQSIQLPPREQRGGSVPIGRPLANTRAYLLDEWQQSVPDGVVGELYLAGAGLAAGYQPEQSKSGFLEMELAGERHRLYRTGDWVRVVEPGVLEFVGRRDEQVKLRGYRIELGEIEAQLKRHPAIRQAVVQKRKEETGEEYLVGYIIPWKQPGPGQQEIREALLKDLPAYQVPNWIVTLEQLPLTANGKLDRQRLPAPVQDEEKAPVARPEEPRTPVEEVMAGIWEEALDLKGVGRNEDFFRLGGHSLLGTRVIARLRTIFGVEVPIGWLFEAPTVAGLSRHITEALRQGQGVDAAPIVHVARTQQPLPLSFAQQRLWFLDQLEPGSTAYSLPRAVRLRGNLDHAALEQALTTVMHRHESLRTTFPIHAGEPVQHIHAEPLTRLVRLDLRALAPQQRECELYRLARQEAEQPFDLARGPLLRIRLLLLDVQDQVLLLTMHHIVSDGWSSSILVRELSSLYRASQPGERHDLPQLPIQYADYALWQRQWLQGAVLEQQLAYWKAQLAGLAPLELPLDHPRPALQTFHGAQQQVLLPAELSQALHALSQREGVTLFMTLLAAFQVLLARYSRQTDIAVGSPIANRTHEEIEGLIGFFINTLVFRSDLSDAPRFIDLLARVRSMALGAYAHQDLPFEQVVDALHPQRDLSRSPLFQVLFILQNTPDVAVSTELFSTQAEDIVMEQQTTKYELSLVVTESKQGLHTILEYNTDLFEPATIQRLLSHWQVLLEGLVAHPERSISDLPLLTPAERELMLVEWNATEQDETALSCVQDLFEEQVQRRPDAVALVFEELQFSYAAVNRLANALAHALQELGVGPETLVGLFLERSPEQIIGLLGVLKAGGAYLPLDPSYPQERLSFLLADAQPTLLLTQAHLQASCPTRGTRVLVLDLLREPFVSHPMTTPERATTLEQRAYVLYTSGSTGQPKGVEVLHRGLSNFLHAMTSLLDLSQQMVVPALTTLAFDIAALELWLPLLRGGRCVLVHREVAVDGRQLADLFAQEGVTMIQATPSTWQLVLAADWRSQPHMHLLCGGEALSRALADRLLAQGACLWNLYGPTETTIWSAVGRVEPGEEAVRMGRPIENTQLYVLDEQMQPVPIGVAGELYIGGTGVARGYLRRAQQTAQRFVPHPFSQQPGERLYRTGDLVRAHSDGTMQYLARLDQQVKLRGYRIELGEIEHVLLAHRTVRACVVVVRDDMVEGGSLVAYVVGEPGEEVPAEQVLRQHVQEHLPGYMVPARIVALPELPQTPNGKVDRRALPVPGVTETREQTAESQPLEPVEELIMQVWQQVLHREQIGRQEHFFELGGHSLLATQVITRLRGLLGVELPLRTLFEAPTLASFVARVRQQLLQNGGAAIPPIVAVSREQDLPLSFAQQRLWFLQQLEPESSAYHIPIVVRLVGKLDLRALRESFFALVQRHESLRTTFEEDAGQPVQRIATHFERMFPLIDLSAGQPGEREEALHRLTQQEAQAAFDLRHGPLWRVRLLKLEPGTYILLLTMHHIISDGWSMGVFVNELAQLYSAFQQKQSSPLAPLPIQYADYAVWQRHWLQGDVHKEQIRYWTHQLSEAHALQLPGDYPRPAVLSTRGERYSFELEPELVRDLERLSRQEGVTLFMTLLAGFQILLSRVSGDLDIVVGTDSANRSHLETEGLIGFFVNLLALRTTLHENPRFLTVLHGVREMVLGAYAHQELPFEMIVEHLRLPRKSLRTPLVNVLFVMQNFPMKDAQLPDVAIRPLAPDVTQAKFDLALFLTENVQHLSGSITYSTDLFKSETIATLVQRYRTMLRSLVAQPEARIASLEIATEEEKTQKGKEQKEQSALRQNLKVRRGERLRVSGEDGHHPNRASGVDQ